MKQGAPIHFIAIGGSVMHNLALELQHKGYKITGSDDEIFDPAKERLAQAGILPPAIGWFPEKIHDQLEAVI
ncbi:MAG TPA: peptidoglycan synthetase, partial [Microscillaceae bacterium]|nr:peptidoglycan synthetase [Microscillaceae bacterium]